MNKYIKKDICCSECRKKKDTKYFCKYCDYCLCKDCVYDEYEIVNNTCILCYNIKFC